MTTELTKAAQQALEACHEHSDGRHREDFDGTCIGCGAVMNPNNPHQSALTQRPAAQEVDWSTPTTYAQRFSEAVALLCRETPPADMVAGWLDLHGVGADDHRLQDWACERAPAWAQGIGLLDAAHIMAGQPTEGVDHEPAPQQATPEPDCTRSHPHEEMSPMCELRTEIARLLNENTRLKAATPEPVGEPEHHRQAWAALAEACQRVAKTEGSSVDLASAIDRFSDVLMGDTRPAPVETDPVGYLSPEALLALRNDGTRANLYPSKIRDTDVAVYTRPAPGVPDWLEEQIMEALRDGLSVCMSVSVSRDRKISRDGCTLYAQTEEWCRWLDAEVGPKIRAAVDALAAAQAKGAAHD